MPSILFVCTANRFRSPLASLYFAREVVRHGHDKQFRVSSAGTWTMADQPVTTDALQIAAKYELNLNLHKSRPVSKRILSTADLILVMEAGHQESLSHEFPAIRERIFLLSEAAGQIPFDIPDPYNSDESPNLIAGEIIDLIDIGYDQIINLAWKMAKKDTKNAHSDEMGHHHP
jgi:protein-tyrosine phosphatase